MGCEMSNNPLILDSSISVSTWMDITTAPPVTIPLATLFLDTKTLQDVTDGDIKKINFYNITLTADSNTTTTGTLSGFITVNNDTLAVLSSLTPSVLASERSIFDSISGLTVNETGLGTLLQAVKHPPTSPLQVKIILGSSTVAPIHFKLILKVYGQIQTKP